MKTLRLLVPMELGVWTCTGTQRLRAYVFLKGLQLLKSLVPVPYWFEGLNAQFL